MTVSVRHVLPGFGYFPDDPQRSAMSGIASVAYYLAREQARQGLQTSLVSFSSGNDRMRFDVDGIAVQRVRHRKRLNLRRVDLSYAGPVALQGLRHASDLLHVHSNPYLLHPARTSGRILHYHAADFVSLPAYRRAAARADALMFCSRFLLDRFTSVVGDVGRPTFVVPNGVVLERFRVDEEARRQFRQRLGIEDGELLILFAGNLSHDKGPHVLVEAVKRARAMGYQSVRLAIVGSSTIWRSVGKTSATTSYERELVQNADPSYISFVGALPQTEMPLAYASCDLVICPSICAEAFGLVLLEAMASGKPTIASRVGGIPEVVREGETGLLVEPNDPRMLAEAICSIADNMMLRQSFSKSAQHRARDYAWSDIASTIRGIYDGVLAAPGATLDRTRNGKMVL